MKIGIEDKKVIKRILYLFRPFNAGIKDNIALKKDDRGPWHF